MIWARNEHLAHLYLTHAAHSVHLSVPFSLFTIDDFASIAFSATFIIPAEHYLLSLHFLVTLQFSSIWRSGCHILFFAQTDHIILCIFLNSFLSFCVWWPVLSSYHSLTILNPTNLIASVTTHLPSFGCTTSKPFYSLRSTLFLTLTIMRFWCALEICRSQTGGRQPWCLEWPQIGSEMNLGLPRWTNLCLCECWWF